MEPKVIMSALPAGYRALVIGASGAIGGAVADRLEADPRSGAVFRLSRSAKDYASPEDEDGLAASAQKVKAAGEEIHLLFIATGGLMIDGRAPEKMLTHLDPAALQAQFALNSVLPALAIKHFHKLLPRRERSFIAALSARVGSIGDNGLGGWYGYRAAKAALNQIMHTAAIELARTRPEAVVAALHPGTVESPLSKPFRPEGAAGRGILTPEESATNLLGVLNARTTTDTGGFWDWRGAPISW